MTDKYVKIIDAFYLAKCVNHYYWLHTAGDDSSLVSIENIQAIIALMTGKTIEKYLVDVKSDYHRAYVEVYDNGNVAKIYVLSSEDGKWRRFAAVKEMCHILIDAVADYQPDPCITIRKMKDGTRLLDDDSSPESDSEHLAEIIAMELIYPLEFRSVDRVAHSQGTSLDQLAELRQVPTKYISLGIEESWINTCTNLWRNLRAVDPINLDEKILSSRYSQLLHRLA